MPAPRLGRGRPRSDSQDRHGAGYRRVVHALRRKPMALAGPVDRNQLFPRPAEPSEELEIGAVFDDG